MSVAVDGEWLMRLVVDGMGGTVTAEDTPNLNSLSVVLVGDDEPCAKALAAYGRIDGTHVWLDIETLRSFAPEPRSCSWDERFAKSMASARTHGWTDPSGKLVRVHLETLRA